MPPSSPTTVAPVLRLHLTSHDEGLQQVRAGSGPGPRVSPARVTASSNPLRDPRDKRLPRIAGPCSMVLFGVTGDLARK